MAKRACEPLDGALKKLQALYQFMTEHELDHIEIEEGTSRMRLVRRSQVVMAPVANALPEGGQDRSLPLAAAPTPSTVPAGATAVNAPMMGIFYRAASPSSPPFVKDGDQIPEGQILCMIEAMKVFNEVKAEFACTVLKVMLENGKPVKAGQPLFLVRR